MFQGEDNLESMKYKAFISYKHNEDSKQQAAALESALKKYAKPIFKAPIKIFRDEKEILPGNDLDYTITKALRESEYLIYLASREAAQSQWIQEEIRIWCEELKRTNNLIIILLKDDISVDIQNKSINLNKTSALPLLLQNHLNTIPVFIDMKWAKVDNSLDLNNLSYREIINKLVARFNNKTPAEMNDEQVKIDRKNKRLRNISISLISILTLIAIFFAWYANSQKNIAIKSMKESRVRWLVAESYRELPKDNTRALRLAEAAYNLSKPAPPESVYQAISAAGQSSMFRPFYISIKVYKGKLSAISTDLKYILISNNNKVELYELDGKLLYELSYPEHIELAMFSPSGHLVIAGTKHSFDLYDLKGKKLSDFQFGIGSIKNITSEFSSDGQLIIFNIETYNDDSYVMLFDQYGNRLWEIHHNAVKLRPELSKNGHLIKIENKQKIELWEIQNNNKQNNKLNVVLAAQIGINDIRFNKAIELPKNRNVYRYQEDWQCLFSPDSEKILLLIEKRIVYLIDLSQLLFIQLKHNNAVNNIQFSPDSHSILTSTEDNRAYLWKINGKFSYSIAGDKDDKIVKIYFSHDGKKASFIGDKNVLIMNLISREMIFHDVQTSKITWPIEEYIFSPNDNKTLSIQGYNLRIWDLKLISQSEWQFEGARIKGWFSPDNERVLACISDYYHSDRTTFYEFDLNQITAFHKFSLGSDYFVSSFSPNGKYILAQDNNNKICLCNLNLDLIVEFIHDAQINYFAFSPNNQYILSLDDVLLNIWNINGELKSKYIFDTGVKIDAHFSPDSENILLAGHGNPILVNLSGEKLVEYNHGEEGTRYADFSPDGQNIITISNAAKLWEINGKLITTLDNKRIGVASFRVGRGIK